MIHLVVVFMFFLLLLTADCLTIFTGFTFCTQLKSIVDVFYIKYDQHFQIQIRLNAMNTIIIMSVRSTKLELFSQVIKHLLGYHPITYSFLFQCKAQIFCTTHKIKGHISLKILLKAPNNKFLAFALRKICFHS